MSPQFVDFDADGRLDIVAGIFDGSPHLVRGTEKGWGKPEQILDRDGSRIVLNAFWNFDTKKWDSTNRCDAPGHTGEAHATSAVAFDLDGDQDLDLLLGDYKSGRVFVRWNHGTVREPKFGLVNEPLHADGKPIDVPGSVATLRLVDWDGDGKQDLACGSMGDTYQGGEGGGVWLFPNRSERKAPVFGAPIELLPRSQKGEAAPTRPDSGIYMDFADHDGDGDLDLVAGGYSHWTAKAPALTAEQQQRVAELKAAIRAADEKSGELMRAIEDAVKGLDQEAADKKRDELFAARSADFQAVSKERQKLQKELDPLEPGMKRQSFVWLYENRRVAEAAPR
jgi:hypothetical protein